MTHLKLAVVIPAYIVCVVCACRATPTNSSSPESGVARGAAKADVALPPAGELPPLSMEPQDSVIFEERAAWAMKERIDTLPIGEVIVRVGRTFVGSPYVPGTLEADGPERLIVNLRTFDCVTFVENTLALSRTFKKHGDFHAYERELARIRYRGGKVDGYPSRLHYFSDWIGDNQAKGVVRNITADLGGVADAEPITFMTSHVSAYRQLADASLIPIIRTTEERLTRAGHLMVPENAIAGVASRIENGDVIAITTSVAGLDIAHTGIAYWESGVLKLMNAPLVGSKVQISETSIAEKVLANKSQDGIMVARPLM